MVFRPSGCEKRICPTLSVRFSYRCVETIVMTYEAVQVLVRLGNSSGRESRSAPRRLIDSLKAKT